MKKLCIYILFFVITSGCDNKQQAKIEFTFNEYNFGLITAGDSVLIKFPFKNTSSTPLKIYNIKSSCSCTVVCFPLEEIQPGKSDTINVMFQSSKDESIGLQNSSVVIRTNSLKQLSVLKIMGVVRNDSLSELISKNKKKKLYY